MLTPDELIGTRWQHRNPEHWIARRSGNRVVLEVVGLGRDHGNGQLVRIRSVYSTSQIPRSIHPGYLQRTYEQLA